MSNNSLVTVYVEIHQPANNDRKSIALSAPTCDANPQGVIGIGGGTVQKRFSSSENSSVQVICPEDYTGTVTVKCVQNEQGTYSWKVIEGVCTGQSLWLNISQILATIIKINLFDSCSWR